MPRDLVLLEHELSAARARVDRATKAMRPKHQGGEWEEFRAALDEQLRLERERALAKGEPAAIEIDWVPHWDVGAPTPHVLSTGFRTHLIYLMRDGEARLVEDAPRRVVDSSDDSAEDLALVTFDGCYAHKFGGPNDEVLSGHPLDRRGLVGYAAHLVANSPWLEIERRTNSVHSGYQAERWTELKHYLLVFSDDCFECLARGHSIEHARCTFRQAIEHLLDRSP